MIVQKYNTINGEELYNHFVHANICFPDNFDSRGYAEKLCQLSTVIELWDLQSLIGVCAFYCNNKDLHYSYISHIDVLSEYRGNGWGRLLISEAERMSKSKGYSYIRLEVLKDNVRAMTLYRSLGFAECADNGNKLLLEKMI